GRHNPALMKALRVKLPGVFSVEALGWTGDALEAQAFGFLAVRSLKRLAISLPTTTGARDAITGGAHYRA
ncbi:MAG: anhydro-N-acetylmuramic acid kinase, partial [Rickettsiales bacterium]|nr:anhydro-N-acetylmuramic acid kinase [Rickettsiales bacterium]